MEWRIVEQMSEEEQWDACVADWCDHDCPEWRDFERRTEEARERERNAMN